MYVEFAKLVVHTWKIADDDDVSIDTSVIPDLRQPMQKLHIGRPDLANPNSFETISQILSNRLSSRYIYMLCLFNL